MEWKLAATTFATVFLAEAGDKTQLAALALTGRSKAPWTVFASASAALVAATALGVFAGHLLARFLDERAIERCAAALFVGIGVWMWVRA